MSLISNTVKDILRWDVDTASEKRLAFNDNTQKGGGRLLSLEFTLADAASDWVGICKTAHGNFDLQNLSSLRALRKMLRDNHLLKK